MRMRAQGATEYLVLLAVVLVIALVGIALLGFFPGTAGEAQQTESKIYWQSASPIAITEWGARISITNGLTYPYFRIRNTGSYPIRITALIGADGGRATLFYFDPSYGSNCGMSTSGNYNIADYFYMAPGEESYFAYSAAVGGNFCRRSIFAVPGSSGSNSIGMASSLCQNSTASPGQVVFNSFGFEYIQYVENQQITKRQIGAKPLVIKCLEPF